MHQIDSTFIKLEDDETCALLKPFEPNIPPITHITDEVLKVLHQFPEVRKRVIAKLGISGQLSLE